MKVVLKGKEEKPQAPPIILRALPLHLRQDMQVGIGEGGEPFYVLKFDVVTDLNGMQAILGSLKSDGAVVVDVHGQDQQQNTDEH